MNKTKISIIAFVMLSALHSCTNDDNNSSSSEYVNSVRVTVEDFIDENPTSRTAYTVDDTGFHFAWSDGDALGIYPIGGDQVKFPLSSGDGLASAAFDGGSWKLRSTCQYAAYYPFSAANYTIDQTALPVSYTGQTQDGNNSTAHLGAYDYLACAATTPDDNGGVDLTMKHLGTFLRLQLTMPKADTYSSVVLESDATPFVTTGTFDITAATPAISSTATSPTYTINLTNVSTTTANEVITIYAMVAPADLSASNVKVTVHGPDQTTYVQTVTGKKFEARSAYNIAVASFPTGTNASGEDVTWIDPYNGHEYVDLGLSVKWGTCNIGASKPEDFGLYFAWGETTGYTSDTSDGRSFDWASYKWCNGTYNTLTKYCYISDYGTRDGKKVLESSDDAATMNWGSKWRMPTEAEWSELASSCTWTWTTKNGIKGYEVKGSNGNSIFIPAAHSRSGNEYYTYNTGLYWSSSISMSAMYAFNAIGREISETKTWVIAPDRCHGLTVRPVCK